MPSLPRPFRLPLLVLLCPPLQAVAEVVVTPRQAALVPGSTCTFRVKQDPKPLPPRPEEPEGWLWTVPAGPGSIDPLSGRFTAAPTEVVSTARVRATSRADPSRWGEATLLVLPLPFHPFDLVRQVMGEEHWVEPYRGDLPFLDVETDRPFGGPIHTPLALQTIEEERVAGYGLPLDLRWHSARPGLGTLLSYREGAEIIRREVGGRGSTTLIPRNGTVNCTLQTLHPNPGTAQPWTRTFVRCPIRVRGLLPFAGNAVASPGHLDGTGLAARFQQPFGVALWPGDPGAASPRVVVTDPGNHTIRLVDRDGGVTTLGGRAGDPGFADTAWPMPQPASRFHAPTHVAARLGPVPEVLVADSGNHVIRAIRLDGTTATLAGTPGEAGYRDTIGSTPAAFHTPQGIAVDPRGPVYVADQGNRAIRVIHSDGRVSTLAGGPRDEPGSADGAAGVARFTDLKGLALDPVDPNILYVLDGHAVRRVWTPTAGVSTILGAVERRGFRDIRDATPEARQEAALQPCLDDPTGIMGTTSGFHLVDHGNRAVRSFDTRTQHLVTEAGGPDLPGETRFGLLRDGLAGPLDESYGSLAAPRTLAGDILDPNFSPIVTSGPCVVQLGRLNPRGLPPLVLQGGPAITTPLGQSAALVITLRTAEAPNPWRLETHRSCTYTVDFRDPDGSLVERVQGHAKGGDGLMVRGSYTQEGSATIWVVRGSFTQEGSATIRVRVVTDQGVSSEAVVPVQVR